MLTLISSSENSETISIPSKEMEKFGFKDGDEVELAINENEEIVLRSKQNERRKKILEATREVIEERKSALIELGKRSRMSEIFFPEFDEVLLIHSEIIRSTGGSDGLRDAGGLESALNARQIGIMYETDDFAKLAATYAYHLSQAHAFVDGNKRIAAVVSEVFLKLNGLKLNATNDEIVEVFLNIAASKLTREEREEKFAGWLEKSQ